MAKRFYRSLHNKMLGGVAGGLGEYFDIDPVIVRVIFVISALGWGVSILAYIILWIVIPPEPIAYTTTNEPEFLKDEDVVFAIKAERDKRRTNRKVIGGVILILLGILFFLHNIIPEFRIGHFWPLVLILLGVLIMIKTPFFNRGLSKEAK